VKRVLLACAALLTMVLAGAQPAAPPTPVPTPVPTSAAASAPAVFAIDARLPSVLAGRVYPPLPLVRSGAENFDFEASPELAPSGLSLGPGAVLKGQAKAAGTYRFRVTVRERSSGETVATLPFTLVVRTPAAPAAAASAAPAATAPSEPPPAALEIPRASFWRLTDADLKPLITDPERADSLLRRCQAAAPDADALDACEPEAEKALAWVQAVLGPLLGRSYPTAGTFGAALHERRRLLCRGKPVADAAWQCEAAAGRPAEATLPKDVSVPQLLTTARQWRALDAAMPVRWTGDGCGCGPVGSESPTYGLFPFWAAEGTTQAVDFSAFTRIGVSGLFLQPDGSLVPHRHWMDADPDGLRAAQRHSSKLDLVLFRQDWEAMLAQGEARLDAVADRAADAALRQLEASRYPGALDRLLQALQWPLNPPRHLYDGLTLWLDYAPQAADGAVPTVQDRRFQRFAERLMGGLIDRLRASPRPLALQVVLPGNEVGRPGPWAMEQLLDYHDRAEAPRRGLRRLELGLLVLLPEPVQEADWTLRNLLYRSESLASRALDKRAPDLLVSSLLPVTLMPDPSPQGEERARLAKRLADHDWQYGGVVLWPLPQALPGAGPEPRAALLRETLRGQRQWRADEGRVAQLVCPWLCPLRMPLRLVFQGLLLAGALALALYAGNCRIAALGWPYLGGVAAGGVLAAVLGFALLSCDPDLHALRESNLPLALLLALVLGGTLLVAFRRRTAKP
jgi:transposase